MKKFLLLILVLALCSEVFAQKRKDKNPPMGTFVADSQFKDYIPISPMDFEQNVIVYNKASEKFDTLSIRQLASDKNKTITFLPNETVYSTLEKRNGSASVTYGPGAITAEAGAYTVTLDYAKFTTLKYSLDNKQCAGFTKVGVGMRITAKITTYEAGVDVSSLIGLGIAAKTGKLSGQLSIDIIGMESNQITDLVTLPVDISESSVQTALQSLSAIKSKMYDTNTNLYPQILAIKSTNGSCSVFDVVDKVSHSKVFSSMVEELNRQQQQKKPFQQMQEQIQQQH